MIECPRCEGQGMICEARVKEYSFFICDECDACWENAEDIYAEAQQINEERAAKEVLFEEDDEAITE